MKLKLIAPVQFAGKDYEAGQQLEIGDDPARLAWLIEQGVVAAPKTSAKMTTEENDNAR